MFRLAQNVYGIYLNFIIPETVLDMRYCAPVNVEQLASMAGAVQKGEVSGESLQGRRAVARHTSSSRKREKM